MPTKMLALQQDGQVTNEPIVMARMLNQFWKQVESWPPHTNEQLLWASLEDTFVLFLPHVPCDITLTPHMLRDQTRYMKKTAYPASLHKRFPTCAPVSTVG